MFAWLALLAVIPLMIKWYSTLRVCSELWGSVLERSPEGSGWGVCRGHTTPADRLLDFTCC